MGYMGYGESCQKAGGVLVVKREDGKFSQEKIIKKIRPCWLPNFWFNSENKLKYYKGQFIVY